jgi:hypothetical protein
MKRESRGLGYSQGQGYSTGVLNETLKELRAVLKVTLRGLKGYLDIHTHTHKPAHARTHFVSTFQLSRSSGIKRFTFLPQHTRPNERTCSIACACASVCDKHSLHCGDRRYL